MQHRQIENKDIANREDVDIEALRNEIVLLFNTKGGIKHFQHFHLRFAASEDEKHDLLTEEKTTNKFNELFDPTLSRADIEARLKANSGMFLHLATGMYGSDAIPAEKRLEELAPLIYARVQYAAWLKKAEELPQLKAILVAHRANIIEYWRQHDSNPRDLTQLLIQLSQIFPGQTRHLETAAQAFKNCFGANFKLSSVDNLYGEASYHLFIRNHDGFLKDFPLLKDLIKHNKVALIAHWNEKLYPTHAKMLAFLNKAADVQNQSELQAVFSQFFVGGLVVEVSTENLKKFQLEAKYTLLLKTWDDNPPLQRLLAKSETKEALLLKWNEAGATPPSAEAIFNKTYLLKHHLAMALDDKGIQDAVAKTYEVDVKLEIKEEKSAAEPERKIPAEPERKIPADPDEKNIPKTLIGSSRYAVFMEAIKSPALRELLESKDTKARLISAWGGIEKDEFALILDKIPRMHRKLSESTSSTLAQNVLHILNATLSPPAYLLGVSTSLGEIKQIKGEAAYDRLLLGIKNLALRDLLAEEKLKAHLIKFFKDKNKETLSAIFDRLLDFHREIDGFNDEDLNYYVNILHALEKLLGVSENALNQFNKAGQQIDLSLLLGARYDRMFSAIHNPALRKILEIPAVQKAIIADWTAHQEDTRDLLERLPSMQQAFQALTQDAKPEVTLALLNKMISGKRDNGEAVRDVLKLSDIYIDPNVNPKQNAALKGGAYFDEFCSHIYDLEIKDYFERPLIRQALITRWGDAGFSKDAFKAVLDKLPAMYMELSRLEDDSTQEALVLIINRALGGDEVLTQERLPDHRLNVNSATPARGGARFNLLIAAIHDPILKEFLLKPNVIKIITSKLKDYSYQEFTAVLDRVPSLLEDLAPNLAQVTPEEIYQKIEKVVGLNPGTFTAQNTGAGDDFESYDEDLQLKGSLYYERLLRYIHNPSIKKYLEDPRVREQIVQSWNQNNFTEANFNEVLNRVDILREKISKSNFLALSPPPSLSILVQDFTDVVHNPPIEYKRPLGINALKNLQIDNAYDRFLHDNRHNARLLEILKLPDVRDAIIQHWRSVTTPSFDYGVIAARISTLERLCIDSNLEAIRRALENAIKINNSNIFLARVFSDWNILQTDMEELETFGTSSRYAKFLSFFSNNITLIKLFQQPNLKLKIMDTLSSIVDDAQLVEIYLNKAKALEKALTSREGTDIAEIVSDINDTLGLTGVKSIAEEDISARVTTNLRGSSRYAVFLESPAVRNLRGFDKILKHPLLQKRLIEKWENEEPPRNLIPFQRALNAAHTVLGLRRAFLDAFGIKLTLPEIEQLGLAQLIGTTLELSAMGDQLKRNAGNELGRLEEISAYENLMIRRIFIERGGDQHRVYPSRQLNQELRIPGDAKIDEIAHGLQLSPSEVKELKADREKIRKVYTAFLDPQTRQTSIANKLLRNLLLKHGLRLKANVTSDELTKLRDAPYHELSFRGTASAASFITDYLAPILDTSSYEPQLLSEIITERDFNAIKRFYFLSHHSFTHINDAISNYNFLREESGNLKFLEKRLELIEIQWRDLGGVHKGVSALIELKEAMADHEKAKETLNNLKKLYKENLAEFKILRKIAREFRACVRFKKDNKTIDPIATKASLKGRVENSKVDSIYKLLDAEFGNRPGRITAGIQHIPLEIRKLEDLLLKCDEIGQHLQRESNYRAGVSSQEHAAFGDTRSEIGNIGDETDVDALFQEAEAKHSNAGGSIQEEKRPADGAVYGRMRTGSVPTLLEGKQYVTVNREDKSYYVTTCHQNSLRVEAYVNTADDVKEYKQVDSVLQFLMEKTMDKLLPEFQFNDKKVVEFLQGFKTRPMTARNLADFFESKGYGSIFPYISISGISCKDLVKKFEKNQKEDYRGVLLYRYKATAVQMIEEFRAKTTDRIKIDGVDKHLVQFMVLYCEVQGYKYDLIAGQFKTNYTDAERAAVKYYAEVEKGLLRSPSVDLRAGKGTPVKEVKAKIDAMSEQIEEQKKNLPSMSPGIKIR